MLLRVIPPGFHRETVLAVDAALTTVDDLREAHAAVGGLSVDGDGTVVLVATPDDSLADVVRRVTAALQEARRVRVTAA